MDREELATEVARRRWYHTIELVDGVTTDGLFDHRPVLAKYALPPDLSGQRVLDVGAFDGFFSFEFERRGADVVALEVPSAEALDWPAHLSPRPDGRPVKSNNFDLAKATLGAMVRREFVSVYDVTEESLGSFDIVFVGSILVHLRDPIGALRALLPLCRRELILCEAIDRRLDLFPRVPLARLTAMSPHMTWWLPNRRGLEHMVRAAGFLDVRIAEPFTVPYLHQRGGVRHAVLRARAPGLAG